MDHANLLPRKDPKCKTLDWFPNVNSQMSHDCRKMSNIIYEYGTAGFRDTWYHIRYMMYRMAILAVLRSKVKKAATGLMITASHNKEIDNGVKLVDPSGEMLEASWEKFATDLVNVEDLDVESILHDICVKEDINLHEPATVIIGRDTRQSSPELLKIATKGIRAVDGTIIDLGEVTTPQLHYVVLCKSTNGTYGDPTLEGYYSKFATAFKNVRGIEEKKNNYTNVIYLDAANGVGAIAVRELQKYLKDALDIKLFNDGDGGLNSRCGADYVKVRQELPLNTPSETYVKCVSIDGDADRIVYFYTDKGNKLHLLDGDRIGTLIASYFKELLEASGLSLQLGLVQTAYANGASTSYISNVLALPVECVPTGVKHLHKKAKEFDIGVYFEANGHGTVIFKDTAKQAIKNHAEDATLSETQKAASTKLRDMIDMINETVGDALSDMLLIETILYAKDWGIIDWEKSYNDLPYKQLKVRVRSRTIFKTTDAERRCVYPPGLQEEIDRIVAKYRKGRAFVRPSGTEDFVRIYTECENASEIDELTVQIALFTSRFAENDYLE